MIKLSTQFEASSAQVTASAAAGGSTSTTCCSCIVTLATASVLTSMHFSSLVPITQGAQTEQGSSAVMPGMPAPVQKTAEEEKKARSIFGFFLLPMSLIAGGITLGIGGVLVWFGSFMNAYKKSGSNMGAGFGIALLVLIGILVFTAAEMYAWMSLL